MRCEIFIYWLANHNPLWEAYCAFISVQIIALDKQQGVHPFGVRETWQRLFAKCILRIMGAKSTNA